MSSALHPEVQKAIRRIYTPKDKSGKPLSDVLFIGPFVAGLATFCPQAFPGEDIVDRIIQVRSRLSVVLPGATYTPGNWPYGSPVICTRAVMRRAGWPKPGRLLLSPRILVAGFGELRNSVSVRYDLETGKTVLVNPVTGEPTEPEIVVDRRYGLHYLLRGDEFEFEFLTWQGNRSRYLYSLRPLDEGPSLLEVPSEGGETFLTV